MTIFGVGRMTILGCGKDDNLVVDSVEGLKRGDAFFDDEAVYVDVEGDA